MVTIEERVARGAALLDAEQPGWEARIDPAALQISSCADCVLGQVFGDFVEGCHLLMIGTLGPAQRRGFDAATHELHDLRREWLRVVAERLRRSKRRDRGNHLEVSPARDQ